MSRLGRSRTYHILVAATSLCFCIMLPGTSTKSPWSNLGKMFIPVVILLVDSAIRFVVFGMKGLLSKADYIAAGISGNLFLFNFVFVASSVMRLAPVLSLAFAIRCIVAVQHSVTFKESFRPVLRRYVVERHKRESGRPSASSTVELDLCFITSRIVVVSKGSLTNPEHTFLEDKYSNFLKNLPSVSSCEILPLASVTTIVESAVFHMFSNPVNVISINTPEGDCNSVLLVCAILLRTGAVRPLTAAAALRHYLSTRYVVTPDADRILPKCLMSQLRIFEQIMARNASTEFLKSLSSSTQSQFSLKRVTLSHFNAEAFTDLRLSIVDVETGKVHTSGVAPSATSSSLTFLCPSKLGQDTLFVFEDGAADLPLFKLYVHSVFHLQKDIASTCTHHFVTSTDVCDHWTSRTRGVGARIEVTATATDSSDLSVEPKNVIEEVDRELLLLPTYSASTASVLV